ncbi:MAG: STAS domain-containing protein [Blastocatellia bacterium]|nr:STAS domain-containing protein [Blastocatellia bacterium]
MSTINVIGQNTKIIILYIGAVQIIDATGLVSLESVLKLLKEKGVFVIIAGVKKQPASVLAKAGIHNQENSIFICRKFSKALEQAWAYSKNINSKTEQKTEGISYLETSKI